ncbi:MAG: hypothetical protein WB611_15925 [Stellaceae bacterium]
MTAKQHHCRDRGRSQRRFGIEVKVRDHEAVEATVTQIVQKWGRSNVLVANTSGGRGYQHL